MPNMQKVIKGFECCHVMVHDLGPDKTSCGICPYKDVQTEEQIDLGGIECIAVLHDDALALLKERELDIETLKNVIKDMVEGLMIAGDRIVDVVRCKDCTYLNADTGICIVGIPHGHKDTFYCAYGKRAVKWDA